MHRGILSWSENISFQLILYRDFCSHADVQGKKKGSVKQQIAADEPGCSGPKGFILPSLLLINVPVYFPDSKGGNGLPIRQECHLHISSRGRKALGWKAEDRTAGPRGFFFFLLVGMETYLWNFRAPECLLNVCMYIFHLPRQILLHLDLGVLLCNLREFFFLTVPEVNVNHYFCLLVAK